MQQAVPSSETGPHPFQQEQRSPRLTQERIAQLSYTDFEHELQAVLSAREALDRTDTMLGQRTAEYATQRVSKLMRRESTAPGDDFEQTIFWLLARYPTFPFSYHSSVGSSLDHEHIDFLLATPGKRLIAIDTTTNTRAIPGKFSQLLEAGTQTPRSLQLSGLQRGVPVIRCLITPPSDRGLQRLLYNTTERLQQPRSAPEPIEQTTIRPLQSWIIDQLIVNIDHQLSYHLNKSEPHLPTLNDLEATKQELEELRTAMAASPLQTDGR